MHASPETFSIVYSFFDFSSIQDIPYKTQDLVGNLKGGTYCSVAIIENAKETRSIAERHNSVYQINLRVMASLESKPLVSGIYVLLHKREMRSTLFLGFK